ncbi:hypothetical protein SK128_019592 [Halocaridina rubra]|uniref:Uncharacterized protein n=1 Tax=Halocaridina rubra TaxID=373956 RepID=A0AAN8WWM6_HALRR
MKTSPDWWEDGSSANPDRQVIQFMCFGGLNTLTLVNFMPLLSRDPSWMNVGKSEGKSESGRSLLNITFLVRRTEGALTYAQTNVTFPQPENDVLVYVLNELREHFGKRFLNLQRMEKLTEFVSKSFDPTKSALSVQYLAQSAARPDPMRSETPGGGTESDSSGPHDLRVAVPHPALSLGLPLDLPRYPGMPITSAALPYPLPLLMAHRHSAQLSALALHQHHHPPSPRSSSPPSPRRYDNNSPKRRRKLSTPDDRRSPNAAGAAEEEEDVDVEASDLQEEAANLSLTKSRTVTPPRISDGSSSGHAVDRDDLLPVKSEPSDSLSNSDTSVTSSQDLINNNSSIGSKEREDFAGRNLRSSPSSSPGSPASALARATISHPAMEVLNASVGNNSTIPRPLSKDSVSVRKSPADDSDRLVMVSPGKHWQRRI